MQKQEQQIAHNGRVYRVRTTPVTGPHGLLCDLSRVTDLKCWQPATVLIEVKETLLAHFACVHHIEQVQTILLDRASAATPPANLQRGTIIDVSTCAQCGAPERIIHIIETYPGIEVWECSNGHRHEVRMPLES